MADKSTHAVLDALRRALAEPAGVPLVGGKAAPGLFPATAPARQAAQRCKDDGLLHVARTEARGKATLEICTLTEKGLAYLLNQADPKPVLEDLVRALEARQGEAGELLHLARRMQTGLDALKATAEKVLQQVHRPVAAVPPPANGSDAWPTTVLVYLARWQSGGATEDCPLPELFREAARTCSLSIGRFHDGVRHLHEKQQIYLHPWTGPLYAMPEPHYALLVGHEIAYYASLRNP